MITIRNTFHISITVRDMDESLAFYRDILGMKVVKDGILAGERMDEALSLKDVRARMVWLEAGEGPCVELLHFMHPAGRRLGRNENDTGIGHVCFEVEDLKDAYEYIRSKGVRVAFFPETPTVGGILDGYYSFHMLDPNDVNIELKEMVPPR
jgi:catechol 2,3-dioxygenase-like lactoylglutathione lyase family enzyme